jgi:hypothetical protein
MSEKMLKIKLCTECWHCYGLFCLKDHLNKFKISTYPYIPRECSLENYPSKTKYENRR